MEDPGHRDSESNDPLLLHQSLAPLLLLRHEIHQQKRHRHVLIKGKLVGDVPWNIVNRVANPIDNHGVVKVVEENAINGL